MLLKITIIAASELAENSSLQTKMSSINEPFVDMYGHVLMKKYFKKTGKTVVKLVPTHKRKSVRSAAHRKGLLQDVTDYFFQGREGISNQMGC